MPIMTAGPHTESQFTAKTLQNVSLLECASGSCQYNKSGDFFLPNEKETIIIIVGGFMVTIFSDFPTKVYYYFAKIDIKDTFNFMN